MRRSSSRFWTANCGTRRRDGIGRSWRHRGPCGSADKPHWQHPANAVLNRNKQCIQLDLKSETGLARAHELIANADIVIESFRPGVMQRLGIDFSDLRAQRPELITLSLPGFASDDQLRRD